MLGCQSAQLIAQVGASLPAVFRQFVLFDNFVLRCGQDGPDRISHERVHMTEWGDHARILVVVEATREHLLGESHEVWSLPQVPLLVGPEGASLANSSLNFIDDEIDSQLFSDILETLSEFRGDLVVATFTHDRFNNYSTDIRTLLCAPLLNLRPNIG